MANKNVGLTILKVFLMIIFFPVVLIYWAFKAGSNNDSKDDGLSMEEITDYEELMEE